jgi:hypothetical protein
VRPTGPRKITCSTPSNSRAARVEAIRASYTSFEHCGGIHTLDHREPDCFRLEVQHLFTDPGHAHPVVALREGGEKGPDLEAGVANAALYRIVMVRLRWRHQPTMDYVGRRTAEGNGTTSW